MCFLRQSRRQLLAIAGAGMYVLSQTPCAADESPAPQTDNPHASWPILWRPHLEWIHWDPEPNFDRYVTRLIARAQASQSDILVYCYESGGYLLYLGRTGQKYRHLQGYDLLGAIERAAHRAGLKFCICCLGTSLTLLCPAGPRQGQGTRIQ